MMELDINYYLALKNMIPFTNRIRYFISQKSGITYVVSHNLNELKLIRMILYL